MKGWTIIPKHYDDGGFSGGNMEQPALKELLKDIKAGQVDMVVVYKIDRLSRSLPDFAKMVETLQHIFKRFIALKSTKELIKEILQAAQDVFTESPYIKRQRTKRRKSKALLHGLIVCGECGGAMSPTYTKKKNKNYYYYVSNTYRNTQCCECPVNRVPAGEVESVVVNHLESIFASPQILVDVWRNLKEKDKSFHESDLHDAFNKLGSFWEYLVPIERKRIVNLLIKRVVVRRTGIDIEYRSEGIASVINDIQETINKNAKVKEERICV